MTGAEGKTKPARCADLTDEICPMGFIKVKHHLDQIAPGEVLEIILSEGEQMSDVPRSIKADGHRIENVRKEGDRHHLLVRKRL